MFKPYRTVLPNGLRVIVVPMKGTATVTVMALVEAGSLYETKRENGISHFLEHMCFKGTTKRPSALAIAHEMDSIGAAHNAFTTQELTGYWAKARAKHFSQILDVVSDMYLDPLLPEMELEKERGVIIEEINMYEDVPQQNVWNLYGGLLYGDSPAGRNVLGPKENIRRFARRDFASYRETHYRSSATAIVVAGAVGQAKALSEIKKTFNGILCGKAAARFPTRFKQSRPAILAKYKKTDQTHFILGFHAFDTYDRRRPELKVAAAVLGQATSSRLYQKLREEMGVCYYVEAGVSSNRDAGGFAVWAGVDTTRLEKVVGVILEETKRMRDEKVPKKELAKAKEYLIGHLEMGLEGSDDVAEFYGFQELFHKPLKTLEERVREIQKVTADEVRSACRAVFKPQGLNLALIGPVKSAAPLKKILANFG